jgi:hypothetical protein
VGIDESRQNDFSRTIDLGDSILISLPIVLQPGIAQSILGAADGDDLAAYAEHRAVVDDPKVTQSGSATWARFSRCRA